MKTYNPIQRFDMGGTGLGEMKEHPDGDWVSLDELKSLLEFCEENVTKIVAMNDDNGQWWQVSHNHDHTSGKTLMEALENAMRSK